MTHNHRLLLFTIVYSVGGSSLIGNAQELTVGEAKSIAREAYIYGYPIVENYREMYRFAIDENSEQYGTSFNSLYHRLPVFSPNDTGVVTPNIDTPYSLLWMDLRSEPLVLAIPEISEERYYSVQLIDLFKYCFAVISDRTSSNSSANFLVAGPDWQGEAPANIDQVFRCKTEFAMAVYRTQLRGKNDLENFRNIRSQYTVQTLSKFLGQPNPESPATFEFPLPPTDSHAGLEFFSKLCFLLQFCDSHSSEKGLLKEFSRIGVSANKLFDATTLSPEIEDALNRGIQEGEAAITAAASTLKVAEVIGTREYLGNDYLKRAVAARIGRYSNSKEEALYSLYLSDGEGKPLEGGAISYVLKLGEADLPPVNAFWSLTMYESQSKALVENPISRYQISSSMLPSLARDSDGGVTIRIQHKSPGEEQVKNWLPAPEGPFYMVMRLYRPKPAAYDGTWSPPLVWRKERNTEPVVTKPDGAETAEEVKPSIIADEPKPELERPTIWGEPTEVKVRVYVIDIDEIDSADQSFAASVYYIAQWKNPFLRHKGPGPMNRGLSDIWNPRLTIVGQQMQWKSYPDSVEIQSDGTVTYRQKIWGRFSQPLNLQDFPFDRQELSIHVVAAGLLEEDVKIVPFITEREVGSAIAEKFSLPDFEVMSWDASPEPYVPGQEEVGIAGYEMRIQVVRQATYYILKVIIPLCLIVVMSWLPRWIDPEQSGTNIGISTSAFLTLVAYLFAITVLLPRVSYITRMDRFILLSTLTVFAGLIQTVFNTALLRHERKRWVERIDSWSRVAYPIMLVLVLTVSFVL
ncbi:Proton-gated ion channel precursor [Planctomycetes bacterium MalM25]|nr:Proton-gated ion channel precursor [Planctomycetes bacterium MalM25]